MATSNPWIDLPDTDPFIAPVDLPYISGQADRLDLRFEIMPCPYMGNLDSARVVLLALNPGFQDEDLISYKDPDFAKQTRLGFMHKSKPAFYGLDDTFNYSGTYIWWTRILKGLVDSGIPIQELSKKIMCIQYFPYHSVAYKSFPKILPSQEYSFDLVRKAIKQGKPIVMMRSERFWLKAVPELKSVPYVKLRNFRNPVISANNMEQLQFRAIVQALG